MAAPPALELGPEPKSLLKALLLAAILALFPRCRGEEPAPSGHPYLCTCELDTGGGGGGGGGSGSGEWYGAVCADDAGQAAEIALGCAAPAARFCYCGEDRPRFCDPGECSER